MSKMIKLTCTNSQQHCCHENIFDENELVSGLAIKDDEGNVIEAHPPVKVEPNMFVACERCGFPMSCSGATIVGDNKTEA